MNAFEPQFVLTAVGLFFTVIGAAWVVWKTLAESQAKTNESLAEMNKTIAELKTDTAKSFAESQAKTNESLAEMNKTIAELKIDTAKSFGEVRGDVKVLSERMDGLDKHMSKRMDGLDNRMGGLEVEVRGINEFLRRESVKDIESDRES